MSKFLPIANPFRVHWTTPCKFPTWHLSKMASPSFTVWLRGSSIKYWLLKFRYWAFINSATKNVCSKRVQTLNIAALGHGLWNWIILALLLWTPTIRVFFFFRRAHNGRAELCWALRNRSLPCWHGKLLKRFRFTAKLQSVARFFRICVEIFHTFFGPLES